MGEKRLGTAFISGLPDNGTTKQDTGNTAPGNMPEARDRKALCFMKAGGQGLMCSVLRQKNELKAPLTALFLKGSLCI
ncbi:hypothetical protein A5N82_04340 [Christensenella minuta]|jgi:hypothetical protein|uniref:Uncharacterized protein n=1 Tax=Christensenella minuta TaxID=626937 RepID=A0A136Q4E1_9FIRM|nr:hypothetical protein B1H56_11180 [Christensenella minuta]KXK65464.1 hypothetical protein HMPREF3293_01678 [Christensenella minuta]OAQ42597.1 hypothetical protein A5N82_04340 [Christensenella minuta]